MARTADLPDVDSPASHSTLTKVPLVTAWFWVVKILTTGFGAPLVSVMWATPMVVSIAVLSLRSSRKG
jgi:uncharacterized membrane-anchored protein